jgi:1,4-alpha-glucan branching enzyme
MWAHPGKKLLFMGQEFAQGREWDHASGLDWQILDIGWHRGVQTLVRDCNRAYREHRALHERDCEGSGFRWIEVDDRLQSVFAWLRYGGDGVPPVAAVANFTPVPRENYRIGLPLPGVWREVLNSDAEIYGGSGRGNAGRTVAHDAPSHGLPCSAEISVPPLATVWFVYEGDA